jgi:hypothetical protein
MRKYTTRPRGPEGSRRVRFSRKVRSRGAGGHRSRRLTAFAAVACLVLLGSVPGAHEIPNDVTVRAFVRPEGQQLRVVMRVPLAAMRDLDYPKHGAINSGMLDISRADSTLRDAATLWIADFLDVYEDGEKLPYPRVAAVRASLQSEPSFVSYDSALAHVLGPRLSDDTEFPWVQGLLDVLFEFPIRSERSSFSMNPRFARLGIRTLTVVRFIPPSGVIRVFELDGDPGLVDLDPGAFDAIGHFARLGFGRLLDGPEEILLLVCLVLPFWRLGALASIAGSFAVAFSISLAAGTFGVAPDALWFRPLIATLTAASILYMALEDIVGAGLDRRRLWAFAFGLIDGFSLSLDLKQNLQFAGGHQLSALVAFDAGLVLGQLVVLAVVVPVIWLIAQWVIGRRPMTIIAAALIGHTAWHWTVDRGDLLRRFRFEWPALDLLFWAAAMRWAMLIVLAGGVYWLVFSVLGRRDKPHAASAERT